MSDNEDNEDSQNPNEESEPSKIPKPASIDHFFNKIDGNPKFIQFESRLKPDPSDKFTKFTYKTYNNRLFGNAWAKNSKMKFETKQGKTKISISGKMFERKENNWQEGSSRIKSNQNIQADEPKLNKAQSSQSNNSDFDLSISTAYENSKANIRIKDKGEIILKLNQSIELIPNHLKAQAQYIWQYLNQEKFHKGSLELLYTNGLSHWFDQKIGDRIWYQKNQTKLKAKISNHCDHELKFNSINHFGYSVQQEAQNGNSNSGEKDSNSETLITKIQLENKLTLSHKNLHDFNFKTVFSAENPQKKQSVKFQTIFNAYGLHNIEAKCAWKFIPMHAFGCSLGLNWNSNNHEWHKKWEFFFEKQGFYRLAKYGLGFNTMGLSIGDKAVGLRLIKKFNQKGTKVELMLARKWTGRNWPNLGIKININI